LEKEVKPFDMREGYVIIKTLKEVSGSAERTNLARLGRPI